MNKSNFWKEQFMEKQKLKELIVQHTNFALQKTNLYQREISNIEGLILKKEIIVITGVRRCGKSSLMRIFIQELFTKNIAQKESILFQCQLMLFMTETNAF